MNTLKRFKKWIVKDVLKENRCFLVTAEDDSELHVLKIGHQIENEINTLKALDHPNIIKLVDYDLQAEEPYMVTKYYRKETLADPLVREFSGRQKRDLFFKLCDAVAYMHQKFTHNDLRADNVFIDNEYFTRYKNVVPIIADFEMANEISHHSAATDILKLVQLHNYLFKRKA